jgi:DedD protein
MNGIPVNLRNLERIQEGNPRASRIATLLLGATGSAAVLVVGLTLKSRSGGTEPAKVDQLAALVAQANQGEKPGTKQLKAGELGFPEVLSDAKNPTTALVAVKGQDGRLVPLEEGAATEPPPPTDQLPVVPLPAGTLLNATSVTTEPKDRLTKLAADASVVSEKVSEAEAGSEGGFSIQVASFKEQADADKFVSDLRRRGHRAYRQAANVAGRGLWHRVRIGSFKNAFEATSYKQKLEREERITALVIDPEKVERQEQARAAKLAERIRLYGSE